MNEPTKGAMKAARIVMYDEDLLRTSIGVKTLLGVAHIIDAVAVRPAVDAALEAIDEGFFLEEKG